MTEEGQKAPEIDHRAGERSTALRTLAEARAQIAFPVPELHILKGIRKERRVGYVEGFIAGRTSVTREQIADVIYANTEQIDHCGYGLMVVEDPLELADKILEQVTNEPRENVLDCKREEESK